MAIFISTRAELDAALASATGGETIVLAPGDYGDIVFDDAASAIARLASKITIRSADPSNPAKLSLLSSDGAENIVFDNVTLEDPKPNREDASLDSEQRNPAHIETSDLNETPASHTTHFQSPFDYIASQSYVQPAGVASLPFEPLSLPDASTNERQDFSQTERQSESDLSGFEAIGSQSWSFTTGLPTKADQGAFPGDQGSGRPSGNPGNFSNSTLLNDSTVTEPARGTEQKGPIGGFIPDAGLSAQWFSANDFAAINEGMSQPTGPGFGEIRVSSAQELRAAMSTTDGGVVILLEAGNYGFLNLYDVRDPFSKFDAEVIIRSADPDSMGVFTGLRLTGTQNLTFDQIVFDYEAAPDAPDWDKPFNIQNASNITIRNSIFDGDIAQGTGDARDGYGTGHGLTVRDSSNIIVENNEFFNFMRAGVFGGVDDLVVRKNDVHDIRSDGFDFAAVNNVIIEGNYIHDFRNSPLSGDHMDMIQFWTSGTNSPTTNVLIQNNVLDSGDGAGTQSIFMRNEAVDAYGADLEMYYRNITIQNNVIHNAHTHGITVGETIDLIITNNTLLHNASSGSGELVYVPTIHIKYGSENVNITNNILPLLNIDPSTGVFIQNNLVVQSSYPDNENYVGDLFFNAMVAGSATPIDLMALPGGLIEQLGVGADLTRFMLPEQGLIGFIRNDAGEGFSLNTQSFDASHIFSAGDNIDLTGARVVWAFGDGSTGNGINASHTYDTAGYYDVVALVQLADGETAILAKTVQVQHPLLISSDFDSGIQNLSSMPHEVSAGAAVALEVGLSGQAIRLNGDQVTYEASHGFFNNQEYTLLVDFKKDAGGETASGRLINFSGSFVIFVGADSLSVSVDTDSGGQWIRSNNIGIQDSDWHRLVLTFSGKTGAAIVYLDGIEVGRVDGLEGAVQTGSTSHDLHIGDPWGLGFTGLVDNLQFYKAAISPEQAMLFGSPGIAQPLDSQGLMAYSDESQVGQPEASNLTVGSHDDDVLLGGDGADLLYGLNGDDQLFGAGGDDFLDGGLGRDLLYGGPGSDEFHLDALLESGDTIGDFLSGIDTLTLNATEFGFDYTGPLSSGDFSSGSGGPDSEPAGDTPSLYLDTQNHDLWVLGSNPDNSIAWTLVANFNGGLPTEDDIHLVA